MKGNITSDQKQVTVNANGKDSPEILNFVSKPCETVQYGLQQIFSLTIYYFHIAGIAFGLLFSSCSNKKNNNNTVANPNDTIKETFSITNLVGEVKTVPDSIIEYLHAQHHSHKVLERRSVPAGFETPKMSYWKDYVKMVEDLPVINPGPGEYVHVMEGHKNGYQNLVIGITETFPGGAPPMHTHEGEESHVLLEGEILYALGDTMFTVKGPYIINIPPMVPHAFKNIEEKTANLVVIFPTNVWKYDVVDYFPFYQKGNNHSREHDHKH